MKNSIFAFLMICVVTIAVAQEKTINKTYKNIKNLKLTTSSGDINIIKSKTAETKVSVRYTYSEDEYRPEFTESEGSLMIEEKFESGNHRGSAYWTLEVQDNTTLRFATGSGDLSMENLTVKAKSNTGSGNIQLTNVKGELNFNTGSGDCELDQIDAEVALNTGSGNIRLKNSKGSFELNAGSGNMRFDKVSGNFDANTGSGDINVKEIILTGNSKFNTGSGSANVSLGGELKHNISLNSGSGNSTLAFNGNPLAGQFILSANEKNGNIAAPFKFDKEETIDDGGRNNRRIVKTAQVGSSNVVIKVGTGSGTAEVSK